MRTAYADRSEVPFAKLFDMRTIKDELYELFTTDKDFIFLMSQRGMYKVDEIAENFSVIYTGQWLSSSATLGTRDDFKEFTEQLKRDWFFMVCCEKIEERFFSQDPDDYKFEINGLEISLYNNNPDGLDEGFTFRTGKATGKVEFMCKVDNSNDSKTQEITLKCQPWIRYSDIDLLSSNVSIVIGDEFSPRFIVNVPLRDLNKSFLLNAIVDAKLL